jgi:hypothetical protein
MNFIYRAKDYNGKVVYGRAYYTTEENFDNATIDALQTSFDFIVDVDPKTVQLKSPFIDLHGKEIYTGDCVNVEQIGDSYYGWHVEFDEGKFIVFNGLNSNRDIEVSSEYYLTDNNEYKGISSVQVTPDKTWFCQLGLNDEKLIENKQ